MFEVSEQHVRQRAYEIWMDGGCADGQAGEHWIAAEREFRARRDASLETAAIEAKPIVTKKKRAGAKIAASKAGTAGKAAAKRPARTRAAKAQHDGAPA